MTEKTDPEVFIIESLTLEDEKARRQEGDLLQRMLHIIGKRGTQYFYIRTRRELEQIVIEFANSRCRYLHISCHANDREMATTFDSIPFDELGQILGPALDGRRLFVSACEMASGNLATHLLKDSGCVSLIGPRRTIRFDDAAAFWVSFYHLMFKANELKMKRADLQRRIKELSAVYEEPINYFASSESNKRGYVLVGNKG